MTRDQREFMKSVIKCKNGCWLHNTADNGKGYRRASRNGSRWLAHRLSYRLFKGAIPKGKMVLHTCDNPPCVRPKHLFTGTGKRNAQDAIRKRRPFGRPRGSRNRRKPRPGDPGYVKILWKFADSKGV